MRKHSPGIFLFFAGSRENGCHYSYEQEAIG